MSLIAIILRFELQRGTSVASSHSNDPGREQQQPGSGGDHTVKERKEEEKRHQHISAKQRR